VSLLLAGCRGNGSAPAASNDQRTAKPAAPADTPSRPRIVALGDSLTAGLGLIESQAYPAILQRKLERAGYAFDVVNAGVSGDTSAGGLRRLEWALDGDVRVLVLALGANDGLRGLPVAHMKKNLAAIIERAKERHITVILAGMEAPPNYGPEYTADFRNAYRELANEHDVALIPFLLDRIAGRGELNQGDGIHPNAEGAEIMAATVWNALRPVLERIAAAS
jgi:acyl-CoA thioesterase-1